LITILLKDRKICAQLDMRHPAYTNLCLIIQSLLSARAIDDCTWSISYNDLQRLRRALDYSGLVEGRNVTEDAFQFVSWIHSQRERNDQIKKGVNNEHIRAILNPRLKVTPYEDQYTGVAYAVNNRRVGIFDDMGCGKSLEALSSVVFLGSAIRKTLLVSPYTVQIGFAREIAEHTNLKGLPVPSGRQQALEFIKSNMHTSWDIMMTHPENIIGTKNSSVGGEILNLIMSMTWDMIIIDEFHMYKNLDAKRTQCILSLLNDTRDRAGKRPRAIVMTGTPISESPMNAYVVLKVLSYDYIPHITRFEDHFVVKQEVSYGEKGKHLKVTGYKNLDELKELLEAVSIRRSKEDMVGFPDRVFMIRDVVLEGRQLKLYQALCGEVIRDLPQDSQINMEQLFSSNRMLRLRQLMNHPSILDEKGDSAKYQGCDALLEEILADPEAKVVLWTEFRPAVDLLYERYNDLYGAVKIYGGVDNVALLRIKQEFEESERPRVAVCIPAKAGTGVDFLARARTAIYLDRPHSFTHLKQSLDRIHRRVAAEKKTRLDFIRSKPATVIFLDVVNSIDVLIRENSIRKQNLVDAVTVSDEKLIRLGRSDILRYLGKAA